MVYTYFGSCKVIPKKALLWSRWVIVVAIWCRQTQYVPTPAMNSENQTCNLKRPAHQAHKELHPQKHSPTHESCIKIGSIASRNRISITKPATPCTDQAQRYQEASAVSLGVGCFVFSSHFNGSELTTFISRVRRT